ncbi:hypothetical protein AB1Y20_021808 [Prymnesium parvum]|uniref:VOC domain-containing protein n=1 Tax=Prymnesium parvum TaxID=97485 RepID=A0AB34JKS8_PRYPA
MAGVALLAAISSLSSPLPPTPMSAPSRALQLKSLVTSAALSDDTLDVPGVLWLEHVNLLVGAPELADFFYCSFLGMVREPGSSWHVNLGAQQLHLATASSPGGEHLLSGSLGLALPSLDALRRRAAEARERLAGTRFALEDHGEHLALTCPWGNQLLCYQLPAGAPAAAAVPKMALSHAGLDEGMAVRGAAGIRFVEFRVRRGTLGAVARFYAEAFGCRVTRGESSAAVAVGPSVHLVFTDDAARPLQDEEERRMTAPEGDGMGLHICIYIAEFKRRYEWMQQKGLVLTNPRFARLDTCDTWEQAAQSRTFRVKNIIDLDTGEPVLELEHEIRPQRHIQFMKRTHYPEGSGT